MPGPLERSVEIDIDPATALFHVHDAEGHELTVDMSVKLGVPAKRGFAARDLLLAALVGCSGSSFVKALRDLDQRVTTLSARAHGTIQQAPPQVFRSIDVLFRIGGDDLDADRVRTALLACRGDCSIAATLSHVAELRFDVEFAEATTHALHGVA